MVLKYPIVILITIFVLAIILFVFRKKINIFESGSKIANTKFIKNTDYYKNKLLKYKVLKTFLLMFSVISIIISSILIARPTKVEILDSKQFNRDIILCMDVSMSVNKLNLDMVETLKDTVNQLHGERFGISIFNTTSVTLVPLTDDYDYIIEELNQIKKSIKTSIFDSTKEDYYYNRNYLISGTIEGAEQRGGSLIGDGLASCVYNFSHLDQERTRLIILTTDNDVEGTPLIDLNTAADISKSKNIKVFGIGTKTITSQNRITFKNAVLKTGGKYYETNRSTVKSIVGDIESTSKTVLRNQVETRETDLPTIPFITLILSFSLLIIMSRMVIK